jgi:hypothetical protein
MTKLPPLPDDDLSLRDLQQWIRFFGGYREIPDEAWAHWDRFYEAASLSPGNLSSIKPPLYPCRRPRFAQLTRNALQSMTTTGADTHVEPRVSASTQRVRLHRERRRKSLRLLMLEMPETAIDAAIARGFLKPEDSTAAAPMRPHLEKVSGVLRS